MKKRIAVIGSGISGLTSAYYLSQEHDVVVYEKNSRLGGHTATIDIEYKGESQKIDTGFIVFNNKTYPNFIRLLKALGVAYSPTSMGFSVATERGHKGLMENLEYAGNNLNTLFSQRRRLLSPRFIGMIADILKFNNISKRLAENGDLDFSSSMNDFLHSYNFSEAFKQYYLLPMASAIWSASCSSILGFSSGFFIRFFYNHGLLNVVDKPRWNVVNGGSNAYIAPITQGFNNNIVLNAAIKNVKRTRDSVAVLMENGQQEIFDEVVFACHSDQALALLEQPTSIEKDILGAIPYKNNSVVLHADETLLPSNRRAWSSWNYLIRNDSEAAPVLTYNMNILQNLSSSYTYCVTLNYDERINSEKVIGQFNYSHPQFSVESLSAQKRWQDISGVNRTWYCGAYWANGFHEDGVVSALKVVNGLGVRQTILTV